MTKEIGVSQFDYIQLTIETVEDVQVVDHSGNPIPGMAIDYFEVAGQSVMHIFDPNGQYVDGFIMGHPDAIEPTAVSQSRAVQSNNVKVVSKQSISKLAVANSDGTVRPKLILTTIALTITVLAIAYAEVNYFLNAYEVATFYVTDNALNGDGWQINCKTWDQIAELIDARISATLNLTSIFVSYVGAVAIAPGVASITFDGGTFGIDYIRDRLLSGAIENWGEAMTELESRSFAVQIFEPEEGAFENVRKVFAAYKIHQDHPICRPTSGALSGTVVDASTAETISGVTITVDGTQTTTTNSDGQYSFSSMELEAHDIVASRAGYTSSSSEISVLEDTPAIVNFALSQTIVTSDQYRVVLTWGDTPSDLDSHMYTPDGSHIYFGNKGSELRFPYTHLDVDDTTSYGPETVTIFQAQPGIYNYSVYNWSGGESDALANSDANVKLFGASGLIREWDVPYGTGRWWNIFTLDGGTGQVTTIDTISDVSQ